MQLGMIQKLITVFETVFHQLGARASLETIERLAVTVHKVMTTQSRSYHTLNHVFGLLNPADPIQSLAALYHDIVYYQVDMGILSEVRAVIAPYIQERNGEVYLTENVAASDELFALTLAVFDFKLGQRLAPFAGLNEFLSALMSNEGLADYLPVKDLLHVTVCIEATIPFREAGAHGQNYFDQLETRLQTINEQHQLGLSHTEIETMLTRAVLFANKDVESFAHADVGQFLDDTWKLMPETNAALRVRGVYAIRDYRQALQKSEAFLSALNPETVFHRYRAAPPETVYRQMAQRAHENVTLGRAYLRIKLLAVAILEALAEETGGEAPMSLFLGDLPHVGERAMQLYDFLPKAPLPAWVDDDNMIYKLLEVGRMSESEFDLKNSPLSLFIYKSLPPARIQQLFELAKAMFNGRLTPRDFLAAVEQPIVAAIAKACATMVKTRREKLLAYAGQTNWSSHQEPTA
jgi:hypothetical protein